MRQIDDANHQFLAGGCSVYQLAQIGSSLSTRSFIRSGSAFSLMHFAHLGSSCSARAYYRCGSACSTLDFVAFGSAVSIRSFVRLGSTASLAGSSALRIGTGYIFCDSGDGNKIKFYATKTSGLTKASLALTSSQGTLHGTWTYETSLTSDRRLKTEIKPLVQDLLKSSAQIRGIADSDQIDSARPSQSALLGLGASGTHSQILDIVRELRPVSFRYKHNLESKYSRFGFIAQELESLLPSITHTKDESGFKLVRFHDLLAVLTLGIQ